MKPGLDGPDRKSERIGRLLEGQADVVVQGDERPLIGRQQQEASFKLVAVRERGRRVGVTDVEKDNPAFESLPTLRAARLAIARVDEDPADPRQRVLSRGAAYASRYHSSTGYTSLDIGEPDPATALADKNELERGFQLLAPDQRALIALHFYVGLPLQDTADALGLPLGTVKSRLHRTVRELRANLAAEARLPSLPEGRPCDVRRIRPRMTTWLDLLRRRARRTTSCRGPSGGLLGCDNDRAGSSPKGGRPCDRPSGDARSTTRLRTADVALIALALLRPPGGVGRAHPAGHRVQGRQRQHRPVAAMAVDGIRRDRLAAPV